MIEHFSFQFDTSQFVDNEAVVKHPSAYLPLHLCNQKIHGIYHRQL